MAEFKRCMLGKVNKYVQYYLTITDSKGNETHQKSFEEDPTRPLLNRILLLRIHKSQVAKAEARQ